MEAIKVLYFLFISVLIAMTLFHIAQVTGFWKITFSHYLNGTKLTHAQQHMERWHVV